MSALPRAVTEAIDALSDLPGIGSRSAERLVLTLLRQGGVLDQKIANALGKLKSEVQECTLCRHLCDADAPENRCGICRNARRNPHQICLVAEPRDVLAMERTHTFTGVYHVLHGVISPMNRIRPEDVRLGELFRRVKETEVQELIFALPASAEGESTTLYILEKLRPIYTGKVTRLARGIPSGGDLDYLDVGTLTRAMDERRALD